MHEKQDHFLQGLTGLNMWRRRGEQAPHKPLLVLLALRHSQEESDRLRLFQDLEEPLTALLRKYGTDRKGVHPEYPFWRLEQEIWEVIPRTGMKLRTGHSDPPKAELLKAGAQGGFVEPFWSELRGDATFVQRAEAVVLNSYFPGVLHAEIVAYLGLSVCHKWIWPLSLPDEVLRGICSSSKRYTNIQNLVLFQ